MNRVFIAPRSRAKGGKRKKLYMQPIVLQKKKAKLRKNVQEKMRPLTPDNEQKKLLSDLFPALEGLVNILDFQTNILSLP